MDRMDESIEPEDIKNSLKEYVDKDLIEIRRERGEDHAEGVRQARQVRAQAPMGEPQRHEHGHQCDQRRRLRRERRLRAPGSTSMATSSSGSIWRATLLSRPGKGQEADVRIEFDQEDLWVRETIVDTKLCVGLIVDESGSMSGDKIHAAMDISLALSELMSRNSQGPDEAFPLLQPGEGDAILGHDERHLLPGARPT